jgi:carbamoyl-phosphate synthase large subunit
MENILILGASEEMVPLIGLAKKRGYRVVATDRNPDSKGLKHADISLNINSLDKELALRVARQYDVKGVITCAELLLPTVSYLCREMDLPGPDEFVSQISTDKYLFRCLSEEKGLNVPAFRLLKNTKDLKAPEINYPFVIKPVDYSGSSGVALVKDAKDFETYYSESMKFSRSGRVIIEEFVEGREFSVETLSQHHVTHIIAITEKTVSGECRFVEERHIIPGDLTQAEEVAIRGEVMKMADSFGINNCPTHTEIMLTHQGRPVLIETGARPGGDNIGFVLVEQATGISMYENLLNLALGQPLDVSRTKQHAAGIQYITPLNYSQMIRNHIKAINDQNLYRYEIENKKITDAFNNSNDRLGYYIFTSNTREKLIKSLDFYKG